LGFLEFVYTTDMFKPKNGNTLSKAKGFKAAYRKALSDYNVDNCQMVHGNEWYIFSDTISKCINNLYANFKG